MHLKVINALSASALTQEARSLLAANGCEIVDCVLARLSEEQICEQVRGVHGVIAGGERWTVRVFAAADKLRIVARYGVGYDRVDLDAATRRGIWVTNTPGATSPAVADLTIGLILCLLRHIPQLVQDMRDGKWQPRRGRELGSLTLGIVGAGSIGRAVIKRARGFGTRVLAYDIAPDSEFAAAWQVEYVELDDLLSQSDVVSLHCSLNEGTRRLIDARRIALMKKDAYLVNTARAPVVDKEALVQALRTKAIAGAALDVWSPDPCAPDDPLLLLDSVVPTPWTASRTEEGAERMSMASVREVITVLQGGTPHSPVNKL